MRRIATTAGLIALLVAAPPTAAEPIRAAAALPPATAADAEAARAASPVAHESPLVGVPLAALVVGLTTTVVVATVVAVRKARSPG